mmetsp:Transcript_124651/g.248801  ORF Transcript_124651/g.248801 Transcript_124651/m.248801 type:complete len:241 (-) Transcript_124651:2150-2872(-)
MLHQKFEWKTLLDKTDLCSPDSLKSPSSQQSIVTFACSMKRKAKTHMALLPKSTCRARRSGNTKLLYPSGYECLATQRRLLHSLHCKATAVEAATPHMVPPKHPQRTAALLGLAVLPSTWSGKRAFGSSSSKTPSFTASGPRPPSLDLPPSPLATGAAARFCSGSFHVKMSFLARIPVMIMKMAKGINPKYQLCQSFLPWSRGETVSETMLISLIKMFNAGPEVSLKGSPTVSPTTQALP